MFIPSVATTNVSETIMLLAGNHLHGRLVSGRKWSMRSNPRHINSRVSANRRIPHGKCRMPADASELLSAIRIQWPSVKAAKLAMKKRAATNVAIRAMPYFFQILRVSGTPCALLKPSIRLTNPAEELHTIPKTPSEKKLLYPRVRSKMVENSKCRESIGKYVMIHCAKVCQRFVNGSHPTMEATTSKNGNIDNAKKNDICAATSRQSSAINPRQLCRSTSIRDFLRLPAKRSSLAEACPSM